MADESKGQRPAPESETETRDDTAPADLTAQQLSQREARYRRELRDAQKRVQELEEADKKRQEAELSEADKAKRRAQDLETERDTARRELHASRLETAVTAVAGRLHFTDPADALALLNGTDLDVDAATGRPDPAKVEKALQDLLKRKPYLAGGTGNPPPAGAPTNPARPQTNTQTFTRSQLADRTFYLANKDAIMAAVREGRIVDG